jgi:hypothetical protein
MDEEGEILIDSIEPISLQDVTHDLAIESGFQSRADLLKIAKHGSGDNVYLIRFRYVLAARKAPRKKSDQARATRRDSG